MSSETNNESASEGPPASGQFNSSDDIKIDWDKVSRVQLTDEELKQLTLEKLYLAWKKQDSYIDSLELTILSQEGKLSNNREGEEKMKQQIADLGLRERTLLRRLAGKDQEIQEYANQMSEMKSQMVGGSTRVCLLDPAVNLLVQKLRQELATTRTKLEDTQNELTAWKFTPDSNTGKRLMAKCRLLYQENEELGRMISSGRLAKLEGELALQKSFCEEVKKSQSEMDELLQELDEDVEGMQSTIYYLQQEMRRSRDAVSSSAAQCNGHHEPSSPPVRKRPPSSPPPTSPPSPPPPKKSRPPSPAQPLPIANGSPPSSPRT